MDERRVKKVKKNYQRKVIGIGRKDGQKDVNAVGKKVIGNKNTYMVVWGKGWQERREYDGKKRVGKEKVIMMRGKKKSGREVYEQERGVLLTFLYFLVRGSLSLHLPHPLVQIIPPRPPHYLVLMQTVFD